MAYNYKFLEHTADVLFEVEADTKEEMFVAAALAVTGTQIGLDSIEPKQEKTFTIESKSFEMLLFDFLQELIFLKDAEQLVFKEFNVKIEGNTLTAVCKGEEISKKHDMKVDAKAITMHQFEVKEKDGKWWCRVIVDI